MPHFRRVTDQFAVSPQLSTAEVEAAAAAGFRTVINNRPDGEEPTQPAGSDIAQAAQAAGLAYFHIPVRGAPTAEQVETTNAVLNAAHGPVLAFCRSGSRSIITWSLAQARAGARSREELLNLGRQAGYDLSSALPG